MSRRSYTLRNRQHDNNLERFKTRLAAKCCVAFIAVTQVITRLIILFTEHKLNHSAEIIYSVAIGCLGLIVALVAVEYFLFKKIGPKIMKYSKILDLLLLIVFTAEWLLVIFLALVRIQDTETPYVPLSAIFSFTGFGWRILFLLFITQNWKLIIIPPTLASAVVIAYSIHLNATEPIYILLRSLPQVFYTIIMLYFLDRIKWREILTNTQQERWIQINDFILNNIPENILILELGGEVNFVSDYCKVFMRKAHLSQNPQDLFTNIQDLNLLPETELSSPSNVLEI